MELGLQVDSAVELVVAELVLDGDPDGVGSWHGDADDGEDVFGDGVVQPTEQVLVDDTPIGITALSGGWGRGEVVVEPKLPDEGVKEGAPFGVVWFGELEHDGTCDLMFTVWRTATEGVGTKAAVPV